MVTTGDRNLQPEPQPVVSWRSPIEPPFNLAGRNALIVDDNMLIALDAESMLLNGGVTTIKLAGSLAEALELVASWSPDFAVLDISLGDTTSFALASLLAERNVPFVFMTGHDDEGLIPQHLQSTPIVRKPFDEQSLRAAVGMLGPIVEAQ